MNVGNQRILAIHADTGEVYLLNNEEGNDDSTSKICLGVSDPETHYQKMDVEVINQQLPIPKDKCIVLIATDGAWHNFPKILGNPNKLDLNMFKTAVLRGGDNRCASNLTPENLTTKLQDIIEEKSKEIRERQKVLGGEEMERAQLWDRVSACNNLKENLEKEGALDGSIKINGLCSRLSKAQGKEKGQNPDLGDVGREMLGADDREEWFKNSSQKLPTLRNEMLNALKAAKESIKQQIEGKGIKDFSWDQPVNEEIFKLSKEEQDEMHWNGKALDDATVSVISPWFSPSK